MPAKITASTTAVKPTHEEKSWYENALYEDNRRKQMDYFAWKRRLFYRVLRLTLMFLGLCCIVQNYAWVYQHISSAATTASGGFFRSTAPASAATNSATEDCRTGEKSDSLDHTSAPPSTGVYSGFRPTGDPDRVDTCRRVSKVFSHVGNGGKGDEV